MTTVIHFFIIPRSVLLTMRSISDTCCTEIQITYFIFDNFYFSKILPFFEITWKNIVERGRPQMTIWRMRVACWITKAIYTHSEYVILIAFPLQQWFLERALPLRYTHIACLVN
jgi:hypothetical protein